MKIYMVSLLHRATIIMRFLHHIVAEKQISLGTQVQTFSYAPISNPFPYLNALMVFTCLETLPFRSMMDKQTKQKHQNFWPSGGA